PRPGARRHGPVHLPGRRRTGAAEPGAAGGVRGAAGTHPPAEPDRRGAAAADPHAGREAEGGAALKRSFSPLPRVQGRGEKETQRSARTSTFVSATTGRPPSRSVARITAGMLNGPPTSAAKRTDSSTRSRSAGITTGPPATPRQWAGTTSSTLTSPRSPLPRNTRRGGARVAPGAAAAVALPASTPSRPGSPTATICSFCAVEEKLTTCSLPSASLTVATPMTQTRQVRPVSIHGGSCTGYLNSRTP